MWAPVGRQKLADFYVRIAARVGARKREAIRRANRPE
jgi:ribosomal protein L32E